jgi:5-methylcytosine-specific restriction protein B
MSNHSDEAIAILGLLRDRHNVLISGPPGTGKSRLLGEVAKAFEGTAPSGPVHVPGAAVPIPKTPPKAVAGSSLLPSPERKNRKVFRTVFHQNSKYRDFLTGLVPVVGEGTSGNATTFRIIQGTLYRASEHARTEDGASLLIIDEINRGPAVQVFGGSIVAIESDKRLARDGTARLETQFFEITAPGCGELVEYAIPHHLYILAAMNQADSSVEPLDVAFLRRWTPFRLDPSPAVLRSYFKLPVSRAAGPLADSPNSPKDVYEAATQAWIAVNERIRIGRGPEFQIGHGVLMSRGRVAGSVDEALEDVAESWRLIRAHIDEIFFGDVRGIAATLNVAAFDSHPYTLKDSTFADEPRLELEGPAIVTAQAVYSVLRAVAG